jgi:hypothetical protein
VLALRPDKTTGAVMPIDALQRLQESERLLHETSLAIEVAKADLARSQMLIAAAKGILKEVDLAIFLLGALPAPDRRVGPPTSEGPPLSRRPCFRHGDDNLPINRAWV